VSWSRRARFRCRIHE